jgi:hypothetical protein
MATFRNRRPDESMTDFLREKQSFEQTSTGTSSINLGVDPNKLAQLTKQAEALKKQIDAKAAESTKPIDSNSFGGTPLNLSEVDLGSGTPFDTTSTIATAQGLSSVQKSQEDLNRFLLQQAQQNQASLQSAKTERSSLLDIFKKQQEDRPDISSIISEQFDKFGVTETLGRVNALVPEIDALNQQLIKINDEQFAQEQQAEALGMSTTFISGRKARIQRAFESRKASVSAQITAKSSLVNALNGNIEVAQSLAKQAVDASVYDQQQKVDDFNTLYNIYSTEITSLESSQKDFLDNIRKQQETQLEIARQENQQKMDVVIEAASNGVDLGVDLSNIGAIKLEDIVNQFRRKVSAAEATKTTGAVSPGFTSREAEDDLRNNLFAFMDEDPVFAVGAEPTPEELNVAISRLKNRLRAAQGSQITEQNIENVVSQALGLTTPTGTTIEDLASSLIDDSVFTPEPILTEEGKLQLSPTGGILKTKEKRKPRGTEVPSDVALKRILGQ